MEVFHGAVRGSMFAQHVPDDGDVGAENATEGLENRVCTERNVVPCEIWAAATEDDGKAYGGYDACSTRKVSPVAFFWAPRSNTYARPKQKIKLMMSFFFV